jgi:hypothetical protein
MKEIINKIYFEDVNTFNKDEKELVVNQGDDEIIEKLKKFQVQQKISVLSREDVQGALKDIDVELLERLIARYDLDGDGDIDVQELEKISIRKYLKSKKSNLKSPFLHKDIISAKLDHSIIVTSKKMDEIHKKLIKLKKISLVNKEKEEYGVDLIQEDGLKQLKETTKKEKFF